MSNQLENATESKLSINSKKNKKKTITNNYIKALQWRHFLLFDVLPLLALVIASPLLWKYGIKPVELGLLVGMYALTLLGITVGFHRHFTHHAFQTTTAIRIVLIILGSMAAQGPMISWVGLHRRHHEYADRTGDPSSPHTSGEGVRGLLKGIWHAHMGWMANHEYPNPLYYATELLRDKVILKVNRLYYAWIFLGFLIPTVLEGLLTWTWMGAFRGFLWGGLVRLVLVDHFFWTINSVCHSYGERPYDTSDRSYNNFWLALPTLGESWHNNHHAFPNWAIVGHEWWQLDISGWVIGALKIAGLAWDIKVPTPHLIQVKKTLSSPPMS